MKLVRKYVCIDLGVKIGRQKHQFASLQSQKVDFQRLENCFPETSRLSIGVSGWPWPPSPDTLAAFLADPHVQCFGLALGMCAAGLVPGEAQPGIEMWAQVFVLRSSQAENMRSLALDTALRWCGLVPCATGLVRCLESRSKLSLRYGFRSYCLGSFELQARRWVWA